VRVDFKMSTAVRHASKQDDDGVTVTYALSQCLVMAGFKFAAGLLVNVPFPAHTVFSAICMSFLLSVYRNIKILSTVNMRVDIEMPGRQMSEKSPSR